MARSEAGATARRSRSEVGQSLSFTAAAFRLSSSQSAHFSSWCRLFFCLVSTCSVWFGFVSSFLIAGPFVSSSLLFLLLVVSSTPVCPRFVSSSIHGSIFFHSCHLFDVLRRMVARDRSLHLHAPAQITGVFHLSSSAARADERIRFSPRLAEQAPRTLQKGARERETQTTRNQELNPT